MRIGINGFGRIGRCCAKHIDKIESMSVIAINDPMPSLENLCYLYNYDSQYGPYHKRSYPITQSSVLLNDREVMVSHRKDISAVNWDVDLVIDSSGVFQNVVNAHKLEVPVIVTHSPKTHISNYIAMGVNHDSYDVSQRVISSSICDVNGIAQVVKPLEEHFGIEGGFITTLHPWLGYQNLVDGPVFTESNPHHYWPDFSLGRASIETLIPKDTTAVTAMDKVLPGISQKVVGMSYRTPMGSVAGADLNLLMKRTVTTQEVNDLFRELSSEYIRVNEENLVSIDYKGMDEAVAVDIQWTKTSGSMLHMVCWYDNEWSYASNVVRLVKYIGSQLC